MGFWQLYIQDLMRLCPALYLAPPPLHVSTARRNATGKDPRREILGTEAAKVEGVVIDQVIV